MKNKISKSWEQNVNEWIKTIDSNGIPSRRFTNAAITNELSQLPITNILDCGCGEGWLTRKLTKLGKRAVGLDFTQDLLENARQKGTESYYRISYNDIIDIKKRETAPFDALVFNFSLYQEKGMERLFSDIQGILTDDGFLVIQTIHPFFIIDNDLPYCDQTIEDSWKGLKGNFTDGHSWFARTFDGWLKIFGKANFKIEKTKEVVDENHKPVSVILIAKKCR